MWGAMQFRLIKTDDCCCTLFVLPTIPALPLMRREEAGLNGWLGMPRILKRAMPTIAPMTAAMAHSR